MMNDVLNRKDAKGAKEKLVRNFAIFAPSR